MAAATRFLMRRPTAIFLNASRLDYDKALDSFNLDEAILSVFDKPWANYVRGVVHFLLAQGVAVCGADLALTGNVPQGAGRRHPVGDTPPPHLAREQVRHSNIEVLLRLRAPDHLGMQPETSRKGAETGICSSSTPRSLK